MEQMARYLLIVAIWLCPNWAWAGLYDPPANYYDSATATGTMLKNQLHDIIDDHTVFSYNAARLILQVTDQDPSNPDNILLAYDRVSLDVSGLISSPGIPGWDSGVSWNREHTWPRSRGVNSSGADTSDLHQLRPATPSVNTSRGNLNFGGAFGQPFGTVSDGGTKWYPGDADAGMIARQEFYMTVRYDGSDASTEDLELVTGNPVANTSFMGDLNRMIEWHFAAPPTEFELRRNDIIFDDYQGNRNPFIDRPEYAWSLFVDQENDSQIAIAGETIAANGATTASVGLGSVLVGAAVPVSQSVLLNKLGGDGTYFSVTASGDATSTLGGRYNAFRTGGADSAALDVGLNTSTATAGLKSGTVIIDNLDVTMAGGAGKGASDVDDVISVALDVLDHATPSFNELATVDTLTFDFGSLMLGESFPEFSFNLFNLEQTALFTAGLDLDAIVGSGDTSILSTNLAAFSGLEADFGSSFLATLDTSTVGSFEALYTLSFSDEDLPGAIDLGELTLMLTGEVVAANENADFIADGDIDGADFLIWQRGLGIGSLLSQGDANGSGTVDSADLAIWQQQFGDTPPSSLQGVPEPTSLLLLFCSMTLMSVRRGSMFPRLW